MAVMYSSWQRHSQAPKLRYHLISTLTRSCAYMPIPNNLQEQGFSVLCCHAFNEGSGNSRRLKGLPPVAQREDDRGPFLVGCIVREVQPGGIVKKSLESGYPPLEGVAFRPIHGFATAISGQKIFQVKPMISDHAQRAWFSSLE
jgi:hypothetical protein